MVATLESLDREVKSGGVFTYVIKRNGKLEEIEFDSDDAIIPDEEIYRSLELYGIATETYEVTFREPGGEDKTTTKLGLLLRIIDENDAQHRGIFRTSITFESAGPKSGVGQIFACILGAPYTGKINNDFWLTVLGGRFGAALKMKETDSRVYINLVHGSFKPVKLKAGTKNGAKPVETPEPASDPFSEDDGEE
jgi:hypothetical protein